MEGKPSRVCFWISLTGRLLRFSHHSSFIERHVQLEGLIRHLENSDPGVQQQALALMNALFARLSNAKERQDTAKVCEEFLWIDGRE